MGYTYCSLDATKSEIRLLELVPNEAGDVLVDCKLHTTSLDSNPKFVALSYVWGSPEDTAYIPFELQDKAVTRNLSAALQELARRWKRIQDLHDNENVYLWIDALCINQDDITERSSQVQLMRRIYKSAILVIAWCASDYCKEAFYLIRVMKDAIYHHNKTDSQDFFSFEWMMEHPKLWLIEGPRTRFIRNDAWYAFAMFMRDDYWYRAWIFQEAVLARKLIITGPGGIALGWEELQTVCAKLFALRKQLEVGTFSKPLFINHSIWAAMTTSILVINNVAQLSYARAQDHDDQHLDSPNMGQAISIYERKHDLRATNPKDNIYALLGLTGLPITPDYSDHTSVATLYCQFVGLHLAAFREQPIDSQFYPLIFLARAGIELSGRNADLPTWVPRSHFVLPESSDEEASTTRVTGGTGKQNRDLFDSDKAKYPYINITTHSLFVWGVAVDKVTFISVAPRMSTWTDGGLLDLFRKVSTSSAAYNFSMPPAQAILRVFLQDYGSKIDRSIILRALGFLKFVACPDMAENHTEVDVNLRVLGFDLDDETFDHQFMKMFFPSTDLSLMGITPSLRSIIAKCPRGILGQTFPSVRLSLVKICKSWRYFESADGYIGITMDGTRVGDTIYMLSECEVPVIMHRDAEQAYHSLIGTTFVIGMMNGELRDLVNAGETERTWLEIR